SAPDRPSRAASAPARTLDSRSPARSTAAAGRCRRRGPAAWRPASAHHRARRSAGAPPAAPSARSRRTSVWAQSCSRGTLLGRLRLRDSPRRGLSLPVALRFDPRDRPLRGLSLVGPGRLGVGRDLLLPLDRLELLVLALLLGRARLD